MVDLLIIYINKIKNKINIFYQLILRFSALYIIFYNIF